MANSRHLIWDCIEGKIPYPPCDQLLGCEIIEAEPGMITVAFNAKPEFLNPMGNIQGGFLAAMLDAAMGQVVATTLHPDEASPTLELKINFLRPAAPGRLIGRGSVVHRGNSIAFVEGKLFDADNCLLATATATAKIIKRA